MTTVVPLQAPFPWFGGKRRVAPIAWQAFGDVANYVEPFFGSGAVLLGRPHEPQIETVNDLDGFVCNAWRAIRADPEGVAYYADQPVFENDLHARHIWLVQQTEELSSRLEGNMDYYNVRIAGYWLWGMACWIGGEFCSGKGPWHSVDGKLVHLSNGGRGVNRKRVHLGNSGQGVNRKRVHLSNGGRVVNKKSMQEELLNWMQALSDRLRHVRVCCGDWQRVMGPSPTYALGLTGVFLDPPYAGDLREKLYWMDSDDISTAVRDWACQNGDNPLLRIVLCGYDGEHEMPDTWRIVPWKTGGGYGNLGMGRGRENAAKELLWISPHCIKNDSDLPLFCMPID